jgi:dipeptidyl aminopeptidase/acylaminoacyl peptidase
MSTDRDVTTRIVRSWLHEDGHEAADRILNRVLDEIDTTPQRSASWLARRFPIMNSNTFRVGIAAAVVAFATIIGFNYVNSNVGTDTPTPTPTLTVPPFGPPGNGVIALARDGDILVADRPGGDLRPLVAGPEDDRSPMFSPDGTRLAFIRDTHPGSSLMVADADSTNVVAIPLEFTDWDGSWSFAPDGRSLMTTASIDGDWRVVVRPVDPAAALTVLNLRLLDASMLRAWAKPTFNPTNAQEILVVARGLEPDAPDGGGLYVYDLATGGIRTIVEPADEQAFLDIAWLPDGQHIIYRIGSEPHIVAADGSGDRVFDALRGRVSPLSNDGNRIVASRVGPDMERWVIVPINGDGEPVWLTCNLATPSCPLDWIWSPDDSMLIGTTYDEVSSPGEDGLTETYLLVDANTGQETELDWRGLGRPAWQRVAP